MNSRRALAVCSVLLVGAVAGCAGDDRQQSIGNPEGPLARSVNGLWQLLIGLGAAVWLIVTAALIIVLLRRSRRRRDGGRSAEDSSRRSTWLVAVAGAVVPGVVIGALTFATAGVVLDTEPEPDEDATVVEVVAHQYWWEISYPDLGVTTANEIHIPSSESVRLELTSDDVIHSFWVPSLNGKRDAVPGRTNTLWLNADEPGTYWGQCTEFCGASHALMRILVIAHEPAEFEAWAAHQSEAAEQPAQDSDPDVMRGQQVFMSSSCVYCHTIAGTTAQGQVAPDLTHLASRETLAAGTLPNDEETLAEWIRDPQSLKPGNEMPATDLDDDDLHDLLAYLQSLE